MTDILAAMAKGLEKPRYRMQVAGWPADKPMPTEAGITAIATARLASGWRVSGARFVNGLLHCEVEGPMACNCGRVGCTGEGWGGFSVWGRSETELRESVDSAMAQGAIPGGRA